MARVSVRHLASVGVGVAVAIALVGAALPGPTSTNCSSASGAGSGPIPMAFGVPAEVTRDGSVWYSVPLLGATPGLTFGEFRVALRASDGAWIPSSSERSVQGWNASGSPVAVYLTVRGTNGSWASASAVPVVAGDQLAIAGNGTSIEGSSIIVTFVGAPIAGCPFQGEMSSPPVP